MDRDAIIFLVGLATGVVATIICCERNKRPESDVIRNADDDEKEELDEEEIAFRG